MKELCDTPATHINDMSTIHVFNTIIIIIIRIMITLMSMMTTRGAIMLMMLMSMLRQWQMKTTMTYTHA